MPLSTSWVTGNTVDAAYLNAIDTQVNTNTTDIASLGTSKQAADSDLTAIAAISPANDDIIQRKAGAWTNRTVAQYKTDLTLVKGDVGLGNVDNTSDATKNAASVTLTNKTIDNTNTVTVKDANLTIQDDGDVTKQVKFQASGISTGQTRILTLPDASTTLVGIDAAQTLTSKVIAVGSNTVTGSIADFNAALTGADFTTLAGTEALTNKDLTSGTNTFPTLNQNTTGSAAKWTTARNLAGNSVDGSANVAFANKFIVQGTTDVGLSGAQFLGALGTGLVKNTTTTGVLSIATSGTDYAPATSGSSILKGNGSGGFSTATAGTDYYNPGGTDVAVADGGTGASTAAGALTNLQIPADFMLVQVGNTARATGSGDFAVGHYVGRAFTATKVVYQFDTADASGSTTVELRCNGSQVTSSSVAVSAANQADGTGTDAARTVTISQSFSVGDRINLQITAVGTTPGKGLRAWIVGTWN